MKIYQDDLKAHELFLKNYKPVELSLSQKAMVKGAKAEFKFYLEQHQCRHNSLNLILLLSLFTLDLLTSTFLPIQFSTYLYFLALLHGYLIYSLSTFTLNEAAAHQKMFLGKFFWLNRFAKCISRLYFADPEFFAKNHQDHHQYFATEKDAVFTSYVNPKRFFISLLPLASAMKFCDFKIHTGDTWTKSKILSEVLGRLFFIGQFLYLRHYIGGGKALLFIFIALWTAFMLDRFREYTEHNLMGNTAENGARNLGLGFWGMLVGGGPWGQPCRFSHQLIPEATWYQQIILHCRLKKKFSIEQKSQFLVSNFPLLVIKLWRASAWK